MPLDSPIRVLVVDGDSDHRNAMDKAMSRFPQARLVGRAGFLQETYQKIETLKPDLVILDYELPGFHLDFTLNRIQKIRPEIEIVLVSEKHRTTSESSLKALELGAMYFIKKPGPKNTETLENYYYKYFRPVINLFAISRNTREIHNSSVRITRNIPGMKTKPVTPIRSKVNSGFVILAIGSSLGGPEALKKVIPALPGNLPFPVVMTQHMPQGFTATLAQLLDEKSELIVREARGGEILRPGYAYLAPGGKHLLIKRDALGKTGQFAAVLDNGPLVHGCRPSVDVMFNSIAENVPGNILAVILTGMGEDGRDGLFKMKKDGRCYCITQDEATAVVYGMPGVVYRAGLSDMSLPLEKIAIRVAEMARNRPGISNPISG